MFKRRAAGFKNTKRSHVFLQKFETIKCIFSQPYNQLCIIFFLSVFRPDKTLAASFLNGLKNIPQTERATLDSEQWFKL